MLLPILLPRFAIGIWKTPEALYEVYEFTATARRSILHALDSIPLYEKTIKFEVGTLPMSNEHGIDRLFNLCLHTVSTTLLRIAEWE